MIRAVLDDARSAGWSATDGGHHPLRRACTVKSTIARSGRGGLCRFVQRVTFRPGAVCLTRSRRGGDLHGLYTTREKKMAETETHEHARTDEALETLTRWGRDPGTDGGENIGFSVSRQGAPSDAFLAMGDCTPFTPSGSRGILSGQTPGSTGAPVAYFIDFSGSPVLQSGFVISGLVVAGACGAVLTEGDGHLTIMVCENSEQRGGRRCHRR